MSCLGGLSMTRMRYLHLLFIIIFLISLVNAETTFFNDPDEVFILGNLEEENIEENPTDSNILVIDGGGYFPVKSSNLSIEENIQSPTLNNSEENNSLDETPRVGNLARITSFLTRDIVSNINYSLFFILLLVGILLFVVYKYKDKIFKKNLFQERSKNNNYLKELINKEVYTNEGDYIGKVKDLVLEKNKISLIKIELDKELKLKVKGISIKYNHIRSVGHIVTIDNKVLTSLR